MSNHIAAIHVLKAKLQLTDDDYRALLSGLTGQASTKDMNNLQRTLVREHMQKLVERMGIKPGPRTGAAGSDWRALRAAATPSERKVWAMWNALHREGRIQNASGKALNAWVKRMVGVDALAFCTGAQLDTLIEALKKWDRRRSSDV